MMYDDLATANRVMRMFDSLLRHCGMEVSFHSDMWKFDTLRSASLRNLAVQDARGADVIIVSAHGSDEPPGELKAWFEEWLAHRNGHPAALVSLLDHEPGLLPQMDPARCFLEQTARRAGLDFIPMVIEGEETDLPIRHAVSAADEPPPALEAFCRKIARAGAPGAVAAGA